ncbi:MAG: O-antigen ligase family protein [Verrucomicrobiota bacterium]
MKTYTRWVIFCLAALTFLAPLKFGTPVVLTLSLVPPGNFFDWVFFSWPNQLAVMAAFAALLWLVVDRDRIAARVDFLFVLPLLFLLSQLLATQSSICLQTSADTLLHFAMCVLLFYAAAWYVRDGAAAAWVFGALGLATFLILVFSLEQHFGGLQQTREYAAVYAENMSSDLRLRLTSNRVFGTLVYPNALAGFLVLAFAPVMAWIWVRARGWDARMKWVALGLVGGLMIFVLALTGSRGGFVAFAAMVMTGLFCLVPKGSRRTWWVVVALVVIAGIFVGAQQAGFIKLGTESVSARRDYWQGAIQIARDHPWLGTGPGTFGSIYPKYKTALTEEAQLVHNNFLQMWSDSGVAGFVIFALLWLVALRDSFELARQRYGDAAAIAVCAALAGWTVHSLMDFDLYVPGVAVPAFVLMGVLQGLKDMPEIEPVTSYRRPRMAVGTFCVAVVALVVWWEGRSLLAGFYHAENLAQQGISASAAVEAANQAIRLNPRNPHFHGAAGDLAARLGRFGEAIRFYEDAVDCDPYRASFHWRLARVLIAAGGHESQAIEQLKVAVALNPTKNAYREDLQAFEKSIRQASPALLQSRPDESRSASPSN